MTINNQMIILMLKNINPIHFFGQLNFLGESGALLNSREKIIVARVALEQYDVRLIDC